MDEVHFQQVKASLQDRDALKKLEQYRVTELQALFLSLQIDTLTMASDDSMDVLLTNARAELHDDASTASGLCS